MAPRIVETLAEEPLFPGFSVHRVGTGDATIHCATAGSGPPLLLLHGYPQTHSIWHRVAPRFAQQYTVVCADLRGYGDSSKPPSDAQHATYSKRATANDMVTVMRVLGHDRFFLAGHDRGGRVSHRLCLDHPDSVARVAMLDISPTRIMLERTDQAFATAYYHWFFLIQPFDFPERMIGRDPVDYLRQKLGGWGTGLAKFDPRALAEYERCFRDPQTIHASCEDYRAAASIDLQHDREDGGRQVACPLLVLWGELGVVHRMFTPVEDWRSVARDVRGRAVPAGHYLPEEVPDLVVDELTRFFA